MAPGSQMIDSNADRVGSPLLRRGQRVPSAQRRGRSCALLAMEPTEDEIRQLLSVNAQLAVDAHQLAADSDLFLAGLSSQSSVALMLAIEEAFEIEFPDEMLTRSTFQSIASILAAVEKLHGREA
jgi:acyl carrier protein